MAGVLAASGFLQHRIEFLHPAENGLGAVYRSDAFFHGAGELVRVAVQ
jgi:hypothetical protein